MRQLKNVEQEQIGVQKWQWSSLYQHEDWLAIWIGFIIIGMGYLSVITEKFSWGAVKIPKWGGEGNVRFIELFNLGETSRALWTNTLITFVIFVLLFGIGYKLQGGEGKKFLKAFTGLFILALIVSFVSAQVVMKKYLEYAFWALAIGIVISNTVGTPNWLKPALKTEFYIKTGLVVMGAEVLFSNINKFGFYGLGIAWLVTPVVIIFIWLLGTKVLKIENKPMVMIIAAATSVCGTSAAIAAAAASKGKKNDLSFAVGISLIFTVVMMVTMPLFIKFIHMDPLIGGAWIGGTVDSTGAVVLAGEALGGIGGQAASLVKMIQNILIGFIAFAIAIFFAKHVENNQLGSKQVGLSQIWISFPKFILGFLSASLIFSFIIQPTYGKETADAIISTLGSFKTWAFCLAFTSIGLESNLRDMKEQFQGGKPVALYVIGQTFNLILTLFVAWLLLSGKIFPIPQLVA
ncbi:YeiH family protein [Cellulosilyticum ruminicola]|uniref:YeiH family protein n=1 Tax=Cellulosilyticum ruminicola TaxID=425254 RepID=UPI0006D1DDEB|nr:putative sulfate exporter family transporter [Cellulosilyticum ruminicola]